MFAVSYKRKRIDIYLAKAEERSDLKPKFINPCCISEHVLFLFLIQRHKSLQNTKNSFKEAVEMLRTGSWCMNMQKYIQIVEIQ